MSGTHAEVKIDEWLLTNSISHRGIPPLNKRISRSVLAKEGCKTWFISTSMYQRRSPNPNQAPQQQVYPSVTRGFPAYQRLLSPSALDVYPYQSPPLQNGTAPPGLFMIDKGRKAIKIPGGLQVTVSSNPGLHRQPAPSTVAHTVRTHPRITTKPETPDTYKLLAQVLGSEARSNLQTSVTTATTTTRANSWSEQDSRRQENSSVPQLHEMKRKSSSGTQDLGKAQQKPVFVRTYGDPPAGKSMATRTPHAQTARHTSPSGHSAKDQKDHRVPQQHSAQEDTPKSSTKGHSDASRGGRKRTHDSTDAPVPSPRGDISNPSGKVLDRLSEIVWRNYNCSKQNTQRLYLKENLRQTLESIIQTKYPGSMLFLVGSSLNGFATNHSDTDLCLMVSNKQVNQKNQAVYILHALHRLLLQRSNFVSEAQVIQAKVPILKFVCSQTFRGLDCDININNATGIRNTHLLQTYAKMDWRVAPLAILIKQWASAQDINDASQGTLSSYSLILMVLNYLQVKCKPCVIPCLHQLHSSTFNSHSDVRYLYDTHPSNPLPSYITFRSENTETLWKLLRGFFDYYVEEFRFQTTVICVRLGTTYPLSTVSYSTSDWMNKYIYIEEPFDRNNTARAVFNDTNFRKIIYAFERTRQRLLSSKSEDPQDMLRLRLEGMPKDDPPVKKKKR